LLLPHDNNGYPPPRSLDTVPTSAPISVSASTSIALQPGTFAFLPLLFALRFVVSFPSSFLPFFPSFLWLVGMGLAAVLARCR
jgi:hypothetical protein